MKEKSTNKLSWILFVIPIALIATCNIYLNTHQENAIINDYQKGDYFVFSGFSGSFDLPFKIQEITPDEVVFLVPQIMNFDVHESPAEVSHGTSNKAILKNRFETFEEETFETLNNYTEQVKTQEVGTFKVNVDNSDWATYPDVIIGSISKMKG